MTLNTSHLAVIYHIIHAVNNRFAWNKHGWK